MPLLRPTSLVAAITLIAATSANGCSSSNDDTVVCPASGTYVMQVTVNGQWITAPGILEPLIESALGSCDLTSPPPTNCTPAALEVTFTVQGPAHADGTLQPITWTSSLGESGTCSLTTAAAMGAMIHTGMMPTPTYDSECSFSAQTCTGGSIDSLGLTFDRGGTYGHAIAAGVSRDGCCYQGTAQKQ